jgi:hypothetical protein
MAVTKQVEETRERFRAKQDELAQVLEVAKDGDRYDFARKGVLEKLEVKDKASALERVKAMNVEIDELAEELSQTEVKAVEAAIQERDRARRTPIRGGDHVNPLPEDARVKTLGERFVSTKEWKQFADTKMPQNATIEYSLKTLFQTSAGFDPESTRSGVVTPHVMFQHAEITDLIPVFSITQNSFKYMEETTRTHAAAERAEAQQYPESTFVFTERESAVRKIADSIPVTDEQLATKARWRASWTAGCGSASGGAWPFRSWPATATPRTWKGSWRSRSRPRRRATTTSCRPRTRRSPRSGSRARPSPTPSSSTRTTGRTWS